MPTDIAGAIATDVGVATSARDKLWPNRKMILILGFPLLLGGIIGTLFLVHIPARALRYIIIGALALILIYAIAGSKKKLQPIEAIQISKQKHVVLFVVLVVLGIYTTSISVGEGTLGKVALIGLLGISFFDSMVIRSVAILPARIFSLIVTAASGLIVWPYLLSLSVGSFLAAKYVTIHIRKVPDSYLRTVLIVATVVYIFYLLVS
jgi:uncharacterized membrane protein YfcA